MMVRVHPCPSSLFASGGECVIGTGFCVFMGSVCRIKKCLQVQAVLPSFAALPLGSPHRTPTASQYAGSACGAAPLSQCSTARPLQASETEVWILWGRLFAGRSALAGCCLLFAGNGPLSYQMCGPLHLPSGSFRPRIVSRSENAH